MAQALQERRPIGGTEVTITQAADRPAAPILRGAIEGERIHLRWDPAPGAGITASRSEGRRSAVPDSVEVVASSRRDWISPPLGPGSYVVRISAGNYLGLGPSWDEVRFSLGATTPPDRAGGSRATVVDDQVTLAWQPATTAPRPRVT